MNHLVQQIPINQVQLVFATQAFHLTQTRLFVSLAQTLTFDAQFVSMTLTF